MKTLIAILLIFTTQLVAKAQNLIINKTKFNRGIYLTFEEFKLDSPSIAFNYNIKEKIRNIGGIFSSNSITTYKIEIERKEAEKIGSIYGFSDGKNVYIKPALEILTPNREFYKVENFGRYCHFKDIVSSYMYGGSSVRFFCDRYIDLKTGVELELNNKEMIKLLKDDETLLEEFKNETSKKSKYFNYIMKYNKNNPYKE